MKRGMEGKIRVGTGGNKDGEMGLGDNEGNGEEM